MSITITIICIITNLHVTIIVAITHSITNISNVTIIVTIMVQGFRVQGLELHQELE